MLDIIGLKEVSATEFEYAEDYDGDPHHDRSGDVEDKAGAFPIYWLGRRFDAILINGACAR